MELKSKKILLTGGHGFLGGFVLDELLRSGVKKENVTVPLRADGDLRVWENCVVAVKGMDVVIHLAANVGGIGYNRDHPASFFTTTPS